MPTATAAACVTPPPTPPRNYASCAIQANTARRETATLATTKNVWSVSGTAIAQLDSVLWADSEYFYIREASLFMG